MNDSSLSNAAYLGASRTATQEQLKKNDYTLALVSLKQIPIIPFRNGFTHLSIAMRCQQRVNR